MLLSVTLTRPLPPTVNLNLLMAEEDMEPLTRSLQLNRAEGVVEEQWRSSGGAVKEEDEARGVGETLCFRFIHNL
jgi:hypothetical protein